MNDDYETPAHWIMRLRNGRLSADELGDIAVAVVVAAIWLIMIGLSISGAL